MCDHDANGRTVVIYVERFHINRRHSYILELRVACAMFNLGKIHLNDTPRHWGVVSPKYSKSGQ
jgi:hypothetical protein